MGGAARIGTFAAMAAMAGWLVTASASLATPYSEIGDAGQTLATLQPVVGSGSLTRIDGSFTSLTDVDLYAIRIGSPATFSVNVISSDLDPQLYLFHTSGNGIAGNDDDPVGPLGLMPVLPPGNALYASLPAGRYLLGIAISTMEAQNAGGLNIFDDVFFTQIRDPIGPGGPGPLDNFAGGVAGPGGAYAANLVGAAFVPEPGSALLAGFGLCMLLAMGRRSARRRGLRAEASGRRELPA